LTGAYPPVTRPSRTWTAQVARARGLRHTVLAFPGGCHLDPMLARLIRDLPAEYLSLEVALNALQQASLSPRTYAPALIGFVRTVRDGAPRGPHRRAVAHLRAPERRPRRRPGAAERAGVHPGSDAGRDRR